MPAGVRPDTATVGRALQLVDATQTGVAAYPHEVPQTGDNAVAGTIPGSLPL